MKRHMISMLVVVAAMGCDKKKSGGSGAGATSTEAATYLRQIEKAAKQAAVENGGFPMGTTGLTPSGSCCASPDKKCAPDPSLWTDGVWTALSFTVDDPASFQYSYSADAADHFMAVAVGDPGCTGKEVTYTLKGSMKDGSPVFEYLQ